MRFGELVREASKQHAARNYARAIALYTQALEMRPDPTNAALLYMNRGSANSYARNHAAALADYDRARQLRPNEPLPYNNAAWLRATSPQAEVRNGSLAVQQATRACEMAKWKNPYSIDTLAAAHAEAGDFKRAVELQKRAISLAPLADRSDMQRRLRLFEQGSPYRLNEKNR